MKRINYWRRRLSRRAIQWIGSRFYVNPNPDLHRSILIAGTARSGTTWLGDILASQQPCRILFEPFNPNLVPEYRSFHYFQYMRPGTHHEQLYAFAHKVFSGEIRNRWIDHQNEQILPKYRLIKEIRANLALKWLHDHFPSVPIIFLMRHPCAVVSSRMELGWATNNDLQSFLSQPDLIVDHLAPYVELIEGARTIEEKHAIIWCVSNLVPLKQFDPGELQVVYYENLCTQLEHELRKLLDYVGHEYKHHRIAKLNRPSQTTRESSAIVAGTDSLTTWTKKLRPFQIKNILQVVDAFGLTHFYGENPMPMIKSSNILDQKIDISS